MSGFETVLGGSHRGNDARNAAAGIGYLAAMQNCATASPEPKRPEICRLVESAHLRVECLSERVAILERRLSSVLLPSPPTSEGQKTEAVSTELGGVLSNLDTRLQLLIEAVSSIEYRLEL